MLNLLCCLQKLVIFFSVCYTKKVMQLKNEIKEKKDDESCELEDA